MHECASSPLRVALRAVPDRARSARLIEMVTQASPPCRTADTCACASLRSSRKVARPTAAERLHVAGADGSSALQPAVREQMPRTCRSAIHRPGGRTNIEHFTECASGFFLLLLLLFHDFPDPGNFPRLRVQISPRTHGVEVPRDTSPGIGWVPASKATPPRASASRSPSGQCGHIDVARMSSRSPRYAPLNQLGQGNYAQRPGSSNPAPHRPRHPDRQCD